jgi:hypothetical protein
MFTNLGKISKVTMGTAISDDEIDGIGVKDDDAECLKRFNVPYVLLGQTATVRVCDPE